MVADIAVREGQHVKAGQVLIELDPTSANADAKSATTELSTASLVLARANALLAFAAGRGANLIPPQDAPATAIQAEQQLVAARISAYEAKRGSIRERSIGAQAAMRSAQSEIVKLQRTIPLLQSQLQDQEELEAQGFGARQKVMQLQQSLITAEQDLTSQSARLDEARAQVSSLNRDAAEVREQFITQAAQERTEAEGLSATRFDALSKADQKRKLQTLTAPVSGTLQQVSVTTLGEVVESGKPIVTLVPDGEELVVEALVLNKDMGFVKRGDVVVIKLEAYPFTRYGTLEGLVLDLSPDAIVDEKRGLVFPARIKVTKKHLRVAKDRLSLSSGMSVSAEIVTGKRRVISYLWSPVAKTMSEAGRER
jgi:hemolysin D